MQPEKANPGNFHVKRILYTSPQGFSIAIGEWTEDGMDRFAMRWTGDINDNDDKGYPKVFGNPMWFQLPYDIKDVIATLVANCDSMKL